MPFVRVSRVVPHLCGLPRRLRRQRLLLTLSLRAFIDESGTETAGPNDIFSMGGWVASVEAWENFSDDWDRELHRAPAIPYFKQKEANSKTEQFAGWAEADINLKTFRLAQVVDRHIDPRRKQYGILTGLKPEV